MPLLGDPGHAGMIQHLKALPAKLPAQPSAILVISAHWEAKPVAVMTNSHPPMLYDYGGFPPETYEYSYSAPGAHALAKRTINMLKDAGIEAREDSHRGYDHGVFVPLMLMFPQATIPVYQVSLHPKFDPSTHIAMGKTLAPLREEGVLIIGSGMTYHNFSFRRADSEIFDKFLGEAVVGTDEATRSSRLCAWAQAPSARAAHPREEHLLPLMVVAGAAGDAPGQLLHKGDLMKCVCSDFWFD